MGSVCPPAGRDSDVPRHSRPAKAAPSRSLIACRVTLKDESRKRPISGQELAHGGACRWDPSPDAHRPAAGGGGSLGRGVRPGAVGRSRGRLPAWARSSRTAKNNLVVRMEMSGAVVSYAAGPRRVEREPRTVECEPPRVGCEPPKVECAVLRVGCAPPRVECAVLRLGRESRLSHCTPPTRRRRCADGGDPPARGPHQGGRDSLRRQR